MGESIPFNNPEKKNIVNLETSPLGWGRQSRFLTYTEVALYRRLWTAHSQERQMDVDWEERN